MLSLVALCPSTTSRGQPYGQSVTFASIGKKRLFKTLMHQKCHQTHQGSGAELTDTQKVEIFNKMKVEVKPSQIVLKDNLNKIGEYKVDINFNFNLHTLNISDVFTVIPIGISLSSIVSIRVFSLLLILIFKEDEFELCWLEILLSWCW